MPWFRRRKPNRRPTLDPLADLKSPPTVGTADYQLPADGGDTARWMAPDAPTRRDHTVTDEQQSSPTDSTPPSMVFADPERPGNFLRMDPSDGSVREVDAEELESAPRPDLRDEREPVDGGVSQPLTAAAYKSDHRDDCPHCMGTGKVLTKADLLRASLALLGTDTRVHDQLIVDFYDRLFLRAPYLARIFPPDLRDPNAHPGGEGKGQRDKLFEALVALGTSYDPDNAEAMRVLDTHLAAFGRAHAAFEFPDGVRPPTLREYVLVEDVLLNLLHDVAGATWIAEFDGVWVEALDHAARKMGDAAEKWLQENGGVVHPRSVRR